MTRIKRNLLANLASKGWSAIISVFLVPVYIKFLGIENYGLIGFFATIQVLFSVLDLGLATTMNREAARLSAQAGNEEELRDLLRTLEIIYWVVAGLTACLGIWLLPLLATHWLHAGQLDLHSVKAALRLMALTLSLQFPLTLYQAGFLGLQRQELWAMISTLLVTAGGAGAVLVLWLVSATIESFFAWQLTLSLMQTFTAGLVLWRCLPPARRRARFRISLISGLRRFAIGMAAIAVMGILLTESDVLILSRLVSLEKLGFYNLAAVAASALTLMAGCLFAAVFPRFSELAALGNHAALQHLYHRSAQATSLLVLPAAMVLALFAREILFLWTHDAVLAEKCHLVLSLLALGNATNALMVVPSALQFSYGWTKLILYQNLVSLVILVPLLFWTVGKYGLPGAAATWLVVNLGCLIGGIQVMHVSLLRKEKLRWYLQDIGVPLISALAVAMLARWLYSGQGSPAAMGTALALISAVTLLVSAAVTLVSSRNFTLTNLNFTA